jgi:hypothetical protein
MLENLHMNMGGAHVKVPLGFRVCVGLRRRLGVSLRGGFG